MAAVPLTLTEVRRQIEAGLDRYLMARGAERAELTMQLIRLRWVEEELVAAEAQR